MFNFFLIWNDWSRFFFYEKKLLYLYFILNVYYVKVLFNLLYTLMQVHMNGLHVKKKVVPYRCCQGVCPHTKV